MSRGILRHVHKIVNVAVICVLRTALVWIITQRVVVISYQHLGTLRVLTLEMGPIGCPETSLRLYHYSLRNSPEERSSLLLCGGILKSHILHCSMSSFRDSCRYEKNVEKCCEAGQNTDGAWALHAG